MFIWQVAIGDYFHVTRTNTSSTPFGPLQFGKQQTEQILSLVLELKKAMNNNVVFKKEAGKNIGNYNFSKCRHITDKADKIWLAALGLSDLWEDIELEHALVVGTPLDNG